MLIRRALGGMEGPGRDGGPWEGWRGMEGPGRDGEGWRALGGMGAGLGRDGGPCDEANNWEHYRLGFLLLYDNAIHVLVAGEQLV